MDWREIGRKIRDSFLKPSLKIEDEELGDEEAALQQARQAIDEIKDLCARLHRKIELHPRMLVERAKSPTDRERFAQDLEEVLCRRRKRGRPQDEKLRVATNLALVIYREWKAVNIAAGINNHGLGDQMKDQSTDYAIEILNNVLFDGPPAYEAALNTLLGGRHPDRGAVREMMDRSIRRRK
jgi:hypothetical protein